MTPAESVTELYSLCVKTVAHLGPQGEDPVPPDATVLGVTPDGCRLSDGSSGINFGDTLSGPGHADPATAATSVADYWKHLGLSTSVTKSANPKDPQITTNGKNGEVTAQFIVDSQGSSISLVTPCIPGDLTAMLEAIQKHREQQSATPAP